MDEMLCLRTQCSGNDPWCVLAGWLFKIISELTFGWQLLGTWTQFGLVADKYTQLAQNVPFPKKPIPSSRSGLPRPTGIASNTYVCAQLHPFHWVSA